MNRYQSPLAEAVRGVRRPARAAALLDYVRARDTVVVVALDRLGRLLSGVIRTVETLTERGVLLRSLREGIDYSTPTGRMLAGIFAALAAASEGTPAGLTGTTFAPGTPGCLLYTSDAADE